MTLADNLAALAEQALDRLGTQNTLCFQGEMYTNATLYAQSRRLQRALEERGLKHGDNICLCMNNDPSVYAVFGAVFRSGATAVPVIHQLTPPELRYIFSHTETRCIVTDAQLVDKVCESIEGLDHVESLIVRGGTTDTQSTPGKFRMEELLELDELTTIANIDPEDVAVMLYTSGTTGRPKGVMLTHSNFMASAEAGLRAGEIHSRTPPLIGINSLPMAHIFGVGVMNSGYIVPEEFAAGYTVQESWFDAERFMQLIQEHRCTDLVAVPSMLALILSHPKIDDYDLSSLDVCSVGAAPLPLEVAEGFSERTGCRIRQLYGMTENTGMGSCDRITRPVRIGAAGLPYDAIELRIVDDQDQPLPTGQTGEIVTRGPTTMKGYFKQPEQTAEALRGGWMHTGDLGYLDEDGYLFVVDRKKDMILKGGENVFPAEVENALYGHSDVSEAAAIGVPHPIYGEDVEAFVVCRDGCQPSAEEIIGHARQALTGFKVPSRIHFCDALPKNGVGKILRRELRNRVAEQSSEDKP